MLAAEPPHLNTTLPRILICPLSTTQASILRQIVSGPRARHPEAGLDLCYVTDNSNVPLPFPPFLDLPSITRFQNY